MSISKKESTVAIQKSLQTRVRAPLAHFDSRKYIQHNLNLGDGFGPILQFMDSLPADRTEVDVRCSFEDGDYSVALAGYLLGDWGRLVGFEVHRWEDGKIVEHWDNLQPNAEPNSSGRSMTDGDLSAGSSDSTAANKHLVERFANEVLIGRARSSMADFFSLDSLAQHSPAYGDGVSAMVEHLDKREGSSAHVYKRLHKVLGEGGLVLSMIEGTIDGSAAAFYDLYRLAHGKIAEHWEVLETLPHPDQWQNENGKF